VPLHIVAGNYAMPWLNMEIFFSIVTRQAIRRGIFTSVQDLIAAIETFIDRAERTLPPVYLDQDSRLATRPLQAR
jgi:hypothetical protein